MDEVASFYHIRKGYAIIFSHENFERQKQLKGTEKDKSRLTKSLSTLGFYVVNYDDLNYEQVDDVLEKASKQDYSDYDCFCITVLSHGKTGKVYAKDTAYPVESLWTPFLGNNCRSLINKPKIFFLDVCRGKNVDSGVSLQTMSSESHISNAQKNCIIPTTADLLVMYATYEGDCAFKDPINGSWFTQSLCAKIEQFIQSGKAEIDLYHLLTSVCHKVAYEYQSNVPGDDKMDEMKEMPQIVSTLTKISYLHRSNI